MLPPSAGVAEDGYLVELQRQARDKGLARERMWEVLLHYKPAGRGVKSLVDDPRFFNAADGSRDPEAELAATLASFFTMTAKEDEHPQCRFTARYAWLNGQLAFDPARMPTASCPQFRRALSEVDPRSLVLVYPNTLINSPTSMFGHTFLRINSQSGSDLLSHAVSYAAITGENPGPLYPIKGLFGFFEGRYSNLPYYEKVKEYNDMELRDIWEYRLNLTPEESYRTFLHVWEMKDFYSDYYFFDENCSFELLFLIEAGRPSLRLTDEFYGKTRFWVIPVDTVRSVQKLGIVDRVIYRPSRATKILRISSAMDGRLKDMTFEVAEGKRPPEQVLSTDLSVATQREVLDLAAELTQYEYSKGELEREPYQKRFLGILSARSTLGTPAEDPYPIATPTPPEQGHLSSRIRAGGGYRTDSWFGEFEWRAAYHDIADLDEGYVRGAQINFMDLSLRYYFEEEALRLHRLHLIDIVSLAPWNGIFKPISWKVNVGAEEMLLADGRDHPVVRLNGGGGLAVGVGSSGIAYLIPEADLQASTRLDKDYALGFGGTAGLMVNPAKDWKVNLWAQGLFYYAGDRHQSLTAALQQTLRFTTNTSVSLDALRVRSYGYYKTDIVLRGNWYY